MQRVTEPKKTLTPYQLRAIARKARQVAACEEVSRIRPRRDRKYAGSRRSRPGAVAISLPYGLRMRNGTGDWAALVKRMRDATGMTGAELSRRLNVDRATIWRWESGRQRPENPNLVKAFAEIFGLNVDDALAVAGLRPDGTRVQPPEPPMDPDLLRLLAILNDPATSTATRQQIIGMLRSLAELAQQQPQKPARRRKVG